MTGMIAQLSHLRDSAAARAVALLLVLGLLASSVAVPHASAMIQGETAAPKLSDCPMIGGSGAGHHPSVDSHGGHPTGAGDMAASGDGCGPTACCPADLAVGVEATPGPHAPVPRAFGLDGPPPAAPQHRRDRPPRIS